MDLIQQLTSTLGVSSETAQGGAGAVLNFLKRQAPGMGLDSLLKAAPEANGWMEKAAAAGGASADAGGLMGAVGGLLGGMGGATGQLAQLAPLMGVLSKLGIDQNTAAKLMPPVLQFVASKLGPDSLSKITAAVPALAPLLGGASPGGDGSGLAGLASKLF